MQPPPGPVSAPQRQGAEGWFPWVVSGLSAVAVLAWAGGSLAALITGHQGSVSLVDAGEAVLRLPGHLGDPASAWPEPARSTLPGPVVYWACQAVVVAAVVGTAIGGWQLWRRLTGAPPGALGVRAEAGFAARRDLSRLGVSEPVEGRLTLGRSRGRLLAAEPQASLAVVGPTGCGKTAGFAIPALLEWKGPVIATSVKSDLLEAAIKHRRRRGRVWVYDPTGCSGHESATWSPLGACKTWTGAMRVAAWMGEAAQPRLDSVADGDYWYSQARKGLAPYLHAAASSGASLSQVVRWVDTQERAKVERALRVVAEREAPGRWDELWSASVEICRALMRQCGGEQAVVASQPFEQWPRELAERVDEIVQVEWQQEAADRGDGGANDPLAPLVAAQALWSKEPRLRGSVFATMENVLAGWADPGVEAAAELTTVEPEERLDLADWLAGDNTIFVVATAHEQARLRPVLTVLVQQAIRCAYDTASSRGGALERPCLVLLDEAGNTAPLRDLPGYASTARSHGITLVTVWQDLAQVRAAYRDRAQTLLNNHRAKLFGTGIADEATLEYVSKLVGDEHRTERNVSTDLHGGRRSVSEHKTYRRAAPMDVLRRIHPGEAVLVYGSELPAHVRLRPWFGDDGLRAVADRPDLIKEASRRESRARLRG
jgi:type IV secretion system protein VirD4